MVNLEPLLEYFGYPENLTIHDLNEIYQKFIIRDRWLITHQDLFTWKEAGLDGAAFGTYQELPDEIYYHLSIISKDHKEIIDCSEPGFGLIKRRKC